MMSCKSDPTLVDKTPGARQLRCHTCDAHFCTDRMPPLRWTGTPMPDPIVRPPFCDNDTHAEDPNWTIRKERCSGCLVVACKVIAHMPQSEFERPGRCVGDPIVMDATEEVRTRRCIYCSSIACETRRVPVMDVAEAAHLMDAVVAAHNQKINPSPWKHLCPQNDFANVSLTDDYCTTCGKMRPRYGHTCIDGTTTIGTNPVCSVCGWSDETVSPAPAEPSVLDTQVGGDHYKKLGAYQPWQVLKAWLTPEEFRGYMKGTAIAYLAREQDKGGTQDIAKAAHTLDGLLELMELMEKEEPNG